MEGLISQGHLRRKTVSSRDRSSSVEAVFVPRITSTHQESSTSKSKKNKMPSSAPCTPGDERGGPSKPQTWKDKPGMAKKRKRANVRPGWEMIEVDDDDEDVISSGRDVVSGPRPSTSGLKSKSNGESSRRPAVYEVDTSSQGGSSSESAQETDEDDYGMAKSHSSRGKNSKKKGKQVERHKSPVSKKQKAKQGKAGKAVKKRALSQDPEIQEIALSSLDNSVFVIDAILSAKYGTYSETQKESWLYTIKWHGFTIAQTAHEEPIPALNFGGDGTVIADFWRDLEIETSPNCVTRNDEGYLIFEPKKQPGEIKASPVSLVKWHMSAYRRYKEDSLRFVKRLKRLEGEGARLDKATIDEIRTLKQYKAEVLAHLEDARREIDINQRTCRRAGLPVPDPDEVEEQDIDTDEALGESATTTDDEPAPPKKKRKPNPYGYDNDDNRSSQSSRPVPKQKVRSEEQKAKNAFKAKVMQEEPAAKRVIKLKIPRQSLSPEVTKKKKQSHRHVAPAKSPEKKRPPKSDDALTSKVRPQEPRAVPSVTPRDETESRASDNRPKPRKRPKESVAGSPTKEADVAATSREGTQPRPKAQDKPPSVRIVTPREKSAPPQPTAPTSVRASAPAPLFLDAPDTSKRTTQRPAQWAVGAESPAAIKTAHDVPQTGKSAEEAVIVDSFPSPDPAPPTAVKDEPQSPGGAYSGSEGEVEHDLGLDAEMAEPPATSAPETIIVLDDPQPRPLPETPGTTLYLRFDNEVIGQRNIGKVRLENISDPRKAGDPLAMFESLFLGGDKELVVDQAIMNADRFLGGQTVNQFARIRPDNSSSRLEINKLTLLMQDKRQPLGVVRVREDLLIVIYSSKSTNSARLGTPREIRSSAGFTMAALFPSREFNVHVNPAVRPPVILSPQALVIPEEPSAGPSSASVSARPSSATTAPPVTAGTRASTPPGMTQTVTALIAGPADEVQSPTRLVARDAANDKDAGPDMEMHIDWDIDVDLGLDMDLDPVQEAKPRVPASPEAVHRPAVQRPVRPAAPTSRGLISAQSLARPTRPATASPAVSHGSVTLQRRDVPHEPIQPVEQVSAAPLPPPQSLETPQGRPPAEIETPQDGHQDQPSAAKTVPPLRPDEEAPAVTAIITPSQLEETFILAKHSILAAAAVPRPSADATSTKALDRVVTPPPQLPSAPPEAPALRTSPSIVDMTEQPTPREKSLGEVMGQPRDEARGMVEETSTTQVPAKPALTVSEDQFADVAADQPMVVDSPDMHPEPLPVEPIAMEEQEVMITPPPLPLSSPPPPPPPSASLPPPPPSAPAPSNGVLPAPPSISPPPLPESSPVREVPPPHVSHTPPPSEPDVMVIPRPEEPAKQAPAEEAVPSPDDSLPVVPPVPSGGGRLEVEVVIDEAEFANSTDGYFKRFCADIHPQDLHPNDTLAAYGFTKYFAEHLLNKRVVIMSTIAKDELKRLVLDSGGTFVRFEPGGFDIMLASNDLYAGVAEAQDEFDFSSGTRELWSFGPADELDPPQWRLKRCMPKRSGLVSFCSPAIIKAPELFLECLKKIDALPNWSAFLTAATIRALHLYIKHVKTPQSQRVKIYKTMNEATGHFQVRYPYTEDFKMRERQQQVIRKTARFNRWVDLQQEVMRDPDLTKNGILCDNQISSEKGSPSDRKYWERDAEILDLLHRHQEKLDDIYAVKRSIFAGFDHSTIRKGLGDGAIEEFGYQDVEGYRMEDLERDLSRNIKFAGLLLPSERVPMGDGDE